MIKKIAKYFIDKLGYEVVNKKEFGNNILRDFKTLYSENKTLTIFDIGANLGQTSLEFVECLPNSTIYAFEPDPNTFVSLNDIIRDYKNIKSYNLGFGERNDKMELSISKVSGGNSLLSLSENINKYAKGDWTEKVGTKIVDITTLNMFCRDNKINKIDILKIDTQGYELKIIEGGDQVVIPSFTKVVYIEVLFVELYKQQAYFNDIYATLTKRGYKLMGFYNKFHKVEKPHYLLWCDAVFVCEEMITS